jgi:hypothetical protein
VCQLELALHRLYAVVKAHGLKYSFKAVLPVVAASWAGSHLPSHVLTCVRYSEVVPTVAAALHNGSAVCMPAADGTPARATAGLGTAAPAGPLQRQARQGAVADYYNAVFIVRCRELVFAAVQAAAAQVAAGASNVQWAPGPATATATAGALSHVHDDAKVGCPEVNGRHSMPIGREPLALPSLAISDTCAPKLQRTEPTGMECDVHGHETAVASRTMPRDATQHTTLGGIGALAHPKPPNSLKRAEIDPQHGPALHGPGDLRGVGHKRYLSPGPGARSPLAGLTSQAVQSRMNSGTVTVPSPGQGGLRSAGRSSKGLVANGVGRKVRGLMC